MVSMRMITAGAVVSLLTAVAGIRSAPAKVDPDDARQGALRVIVTGQALLRHPLERESPESAESIKTLLSGAHVVFTNFEAVIEAEEGLIRTRRALVHNAQPDALRSLRDLGFNLISLSNNHAWDLGPRGILSTIDEARRNGFVHAGTGRNIAEASAPAYLETSEGTVALVSLASGSIREGGNATPGTPGVNELRVEDGRPNATDGDRILGAVREAAAKADLVIVYHHNHIFDRADRLNPPQWLREWARLSIDAGASAYVVHGNPIPQGMEVYRDRPILYSLGNFIFQTRRVVHYAQDTLAWRSVVADLRFDQGALSSARFRPIVLHESLTEEQRELGYFLPAGAPRPASGAVATVILDQFRDLSRALGTDIERHDGYVEFRRGEPRADGASIRTGQEPHTGTGSRQPARSP